MDYNILINGIIHQLFIQNTYMPDDDTLTILNKYFNNTSFTITAFRLTSDNDSDNYRRELSNLIPKYAKRHCSYPVWFYRTEDYNNLLLFNHNNDFNVEKIYKRDKRLFYRQTQMFLPLGNKQDMPYLI